MELFVYICPKIIMSLLKKIPQIVLCLLVSASYASPFMRCPKVNNALPNELIQFYANYAANSLFTFNFVDYHDKIPAQSTFLSEDAWRDYASLLIKTQFLAKIDKYHLISSAYFKKPADILSHQDKFWQVQVPIVVSLRSMNDVQRTPQNLTLTLQQTNQTPNYCGLQITHIKFQPLLKNNYMDNAVDTFFFPAYVKPQTLDANKINDLEIITAVNTWLVKHPASNSSKLTDSLFIIKKGMEGNTNFWKVQVSHNTFVKVTNDSGKPSEFNFKLKN